MPKHKLELAPGATSNTDQHHQDLAHQPPTKRLRVPLNFSIESIMQPASQQQQALSAYQFLGSPDLIGSPLGLSAAAATSYHQNRQSNSNNHHHQQHLNHQQQAKSSLVGLNVSRSPSPASHSDSSSSRSGTSSHTKQRHQSRDLKPPAHNRMGLNERESLASPLSSSPSTSALSSRNSSRVSSPISPGCHQEGNSNLSLNTLNHHHHQQRQGHLNSNQNQKHRSLSSPSFTNVNQYETSSRQHHQAGTSSSSAANATTSNPNPNPGSTGRLNQVECVLDNKDMWDKFHSLNTEMIITKTGRRMFPVLKVQFHNLDPTARYAVSMDIVPVDNKRYRYAYHKSCWQVAGKADPSAEPRLYPHPDSPFNGDLLSRQVISFEKVKLTNNEMDKSGHIILNSMHKYQPRVHLIELKSTLPPQQSPLQQLPSLNGTHSTSKMSSPGGAPSRFNQQQAQQQQKPQPQLDIEGYRTFVFPETVFTAVTAYQNQLITKMKIDKNPFAKGFRDSSRLSDLDRNDPFDYMSSLGPAAAAAAAAACAAGRFPGGPSGGPSGMPLGSLEAAAAAAGLPPPPGSHQGQMDQAYSQLLVSAAAANSPWYSAAAANPFGGMGAACSTAQAAQLQATQLWLAAAFSSAFQNGGSGQPQSLPPPNSNGPALLAPPGGHTPNHTDSPLGSTPGALQQECRGDSRSSG